MAQIALDIKTNADLQAFSQLDAAEQQTVLSAMKLQKEMKQAEAATAAWANAAAQANAKVQAATQQTARVQQRVDEHARRMNLRHGAGTAISQQQRQAYREHLNVTAGARDMGYRVVASAEILGTQMAMRQRQDVARQLRERRQQQQVTAATERATADRAFVDQLGSPSTRDMDDRVFAVIKRRQQRIALRAKLLKRKDEEAQAAFDRDVAPGLIGDAAVAIGGRGVGAGEGDVHLARARRRVSRNIRNSPELAGRVTEAEFETMAGQMADRMRQRGQRFDRGLQSALTGIAAVVGVATAVDSADRQRIDAAGDRIDAAAASRRELKQIADSGADFRGLTRLSTQLSVAGGLSGDEANRTVFAGRSAGLIDAQFIDAVVAAKKVNLDPSVALSAVQKVKGNWSNAGTTNEILGKLLIAAGPSPANVTDIAGAVGTAASPFASIGGSADEALAALGVLSGPNKNVDAAADRLKSVSEQLAKKMGQIVQRPGENLGGLGLIRALPQLAREGRLRGKDGKQMNAKDFLEEQQAVNAMNDLIANGGVIDSQIGAMRGGGTGGRLGEKAGYFDPQTDATDLAEKNKRRREVTEEQRYATDTAVADAVAEQRKANLVEGGASGIRQTLAGWGGAIGRSSLLMGDAGFAQHELHAGRIKDADTRRLVIGNMAGKMSRAEAAAMLGQVEQGGGTIADGGWIGSLANNRAITADESPDFVAALRRRIKQVDEDAAGPNAASAAGTPFMNVLSKLPPGLVSAIKSGAAGAGAMAGAFADAPDAFVKAQGLTPNDYRVAIYNQVAQQKAREAAPAMLAGNFIPGADRGKAGAFVQGKLGEIAGSADEAIFKANLDLIDKSLVDAEGELKTATKGTAAFDRASSRVKGIKGLKRQAKGNDGRIDVFEAQSIVDQISGGNGDQKFKDDVTGALQQIVAALMRQPGNAASALDVSNSTPKNKIDPAATRSPARGKQFN